MRKKLVLAAALAVSVCAAGAFAAPVGQVLADGQSMVIGGGDAECAKTQCVQIERSGDMVYHYAIVKGKVKKTLAIEIPRDALLVQTPRYERSVADRGTLHLVTDPTPPPPPGGNGAVVESQTYVTATQLFVVPVVFFYSNNVCVGVQTSEVTQGRNKSLNNRISTDPTTRSTD